MAIGAYSSAVVSTMLGSPVLARAADGDAGHGAAPARLSAFPSLRLEGAYLALATLGLAESVRIFISGTDFLGAAVGFENIPPPYHRQLVARRPSRLLLRRDAGRAARALFLVQHPALRHRPRVQVDPRGSARGRGERRQRAEIQGDRLRDQRALCGLRRQPAGAHGARLPASEQLHHQRDDNAAADGGVRRASATSGAA